MSETRGQVEHILAELGKKIDHLIVEAKDASGELRDDVEEKIEELKKKKAKLEDDFETYKSNEKWKEAKGHFATALQELVKAVETIFAKKPQEKE